MLRMEQSLSGSVSHGAVLSQPGHGPVGCNDAQDGHIAEKDRQEVKGCLSAADSPRKTETAADHAVKAMIEGHQDAILHFLP